MLNPRRTKVAEQLRDMLVRQYSDCLQLDDEPFLHEKVRDKFAQNRPILIRDRKRMLLRSP